MLHRLWISESFVFIRVHSCSFDKFVVRNLFLHRRGSDGEVIEVFDGGCEEHEVRKAVWLLGRKEKFGAIVLE
jgi:hypothetical protein